MTQPNRTLLLATTVVALSAGCGNANGHPTALSRTTQTSSTTSSRASLKAAVRTAIKGNFKLSGYVLWQNRIPTWATQSTRGPALAALRSSAATRRNQDLQIKSLSGGFTILSIKLAPSDRVAIVDLKSQGKVAPYQHGHRLGRAVTTNDHARIQLRRLGNARHFVVWRVSPIK